MEQLLKTWEKRMLAYRKEADESKSSIGRVKAINKFFVYRDCIKELKEQLIINGVGGNEVKCCSCDYPIIRNDGSIYYCGNCGDDLE